MPLVEGGNQQGKVSIALITGVVTIRAVDVSIFETAGTLADPFFFGNAKLFPGLLEVFGRANSHFNKVRELVPRHAFFLGLLEFPLGKSHFFVVETLPFVSGSLCFADVCIVAVICECIVRCFGGFPVRVRVFGRFVIELGERNGAAQQHC